MKKYLKYIIPTIILILILSIYFIFRDTRFKIESKYYGKNEIIEINKDEYNNLINNEESFLLFVYQPLCANSYNFSKVLDHFTNVYNITIYKIAFSEMKETSLKESIKTYPSFGIFKNGKLISHLNATSDKDTSYFKTLYGFTTYISKYIKIKDLDPKELEKDYLDEQELEVQPNINKNASLKDINKDKSKVNIILFYGEGCPHCRKLFNYLNSLDKEYLDLFNLYGFEVWNNEDNYKLLNEYKTKYNYNDDFVPFIIIDNKVFNGFDNDIKIELLKYIVDHYNDINSTCDINTDCLSVK